MSGATGVIDGTGTLTGDSAEGETLLLTRALDCARLEVLVALTGETLETRATGFDGATGFDVATGFDGAAGIAGGRKLSGDGMVDGLAGA